MLLGLTTGTASFAETGPQASEPAGEPHTQPPAGWRGLPDLAERAQSAAAEVAGRGIDVAAEAWGDPPTGAFGLSVTARSDESGGDPAELRAGLRAALEGTEATIVDWAEAERGVSLTFEWGAFRGIARAGTTRANGDSAARATLLACFYSTRQSAASKSTCEAWVRRWEGMP